MNNVQLRGALDRLIIILLTWASTKGYITPSQVAEYSPILVGIVAAIYGFWINRNTNLVSKAATVPGTTVVTTPELAAATPNETNIISNTQTSAAINKEVQVNKEAEIKSSGG